VTTALSLALPCVFLGFYTRSATLVAGLCLQALVWVWGFGAELRLGVELQSVTTRLLANAMVLLVFLPAGRSFSIDRWRRPDDPERGWGRPRWALIAQGVLAWWGLSAMAILPALPSLLLPIGVGGDPGSALPMLDGSLAPVVAAMGVTLPLLVLLPRARPWALAVATVAIGLAHVFTGLGLLGLVLLLMLAAAIPPASVHHAIDTLLSPRAPDRAST